MAEETVTAVTVIDRSDTLMLTPVMDPALAVSRLKELQEFVKNYMVPVEDYGVIPGTPKPTLLQPGAQKLLELYGLYPDPEIIQAVEDWSKEPAFFDYTVKVYIKSKRDNSIVAAGIGSCNSWETKYRWRDKKLICPSCKADRGIEVELMRSKRESAYYCWAKKGGCNMNYFDDAKGNPCEELDDQFPIGKTANPNIADQKNTILKMAKKRALVDATLTATRSAGLFTQDLEDRDDIHMLSKEEIEAARQKDQAEREAKKNTPTAAPPPSKPNAAPPPVSAQPAAPPASAASSASATATDATPSTVKPPGKQFSAADMNGSKPKGNGATSTKPATNAANAPPTGDTKAAGTAAATNLAGMDGMKKIVAAGTATGWVKGSDRGALTTQMYVLEPDLKGKDLLKTLTVKQAEALAAWFTANKNNA